MQYSCRYCSTPMLMVTQYQWQKVCFPSQEVFIKDDSWVLTRQAAEKRLEEYNKKGYDEPCSSGDHIQTRQVPLPDTTDLIKWLYHYHMKKLIMELMAPASERMSVLEKREKWRVEVDRHFAECKMRITARQVADAYSKMNAVLQITPTLTLPDIPGITLIARAINKELMRDLKKNNVRDIQQSFFRLIDEVCPKIV